MAASTREYPLLTPAPQVVEQEVEVYWRAFKDALAAVLAAGGVAARRIRALGISAQGETLIAVDRRGQALAPAIVWMDNRAQRESDELAACLGNELRARSHRPGRHAAHVAGLQGPLAAPQPGGAFRPGRTSSCSSRTDFIHRLTGRFVAEGSLLCSTTWWELRTKRYWPRMLEELGIGEEQLPEVVEPGQAIGRSGGRRPRSWAWTPDTMVATGALDQACGALGVGNVRPGIFSECTGSNVAVVALVEQPRIDPRGSCPASTTAWRTPT